jgi:integrase/recombinase XerD
MKTEISKRWKTAINETVKELKYQKWLAEKSVSKYQQCLEDFESKMGDRSPDSFTEIDLEQYLSQKLSELSYGGIKGYVVALKHFYRGMLDRAEILRDPSDTLGIPKVTSSIPETLTHEEMNKILDYPFEKTPIGARNRALIELLYATGGRIQEILDLKVDGYLSSTRQVRLMGKGMIERIVPINLAAQRAMDVYLEEWRPKIIREHAEWVFLGIRGGRMRRLEGWKLVKELGKAVGIRKSVYPHMLRHTFATHLMEGGADLRVIQELLGHASLATTQIYTRVCVKALKETHAKFHPRVQESANQLMLAL